MLLPARKGISQYKEKCNVNSETDTSHGQSGNRGGVGVYTLPCTKRFTLHHNHFAPRRAGAGSQIRLFGLLETYGCNP